MNILLFIWGLIVIVGFAARFTLERISVQASIFSFFFALLVLGLGLLSIGFYCMLMAIHTDQFLQAGLNVLTIGLGLGCVWISAKPITHMVQAWLNRK